MSEVTQGLLVIIDDVLSTVPSVMLILLIDSSLQFQLKLSLPADNLRLLSLVIATRHLLKIYNKTMFGCISNSYEA